MALYVFHLILIYIFSFGLFKYGKNGANGVSVLESKLVDLENGFGKWVYNHQLSILDHGKRIIFLYHFWTGTESVIFIGPAYLHFD